MAHIHVLNEAIKEGMEGACSDMFSFCDNPAERINAEYLFTVATARAISARNTVPADPYEIRIEQSTKSFASDCLHPVIFGSPTQRGSTIFRAKHPLPKIIRPGRIDISVYHNPAKSTYFGSPPLCSIELKGFNPPKRLVIEDLKRNLEFHRVQGKTGSSVLDLSFFAALHSRSAKRASGNESAVKEMYRRWLPQLGAVPDLDTHVLTFTVSIDTFGRVREEVNEMVVDTETVHHFIGAIVIFCRPSGGSYTENQLQEVLDGV